MSAEKMRWVGLSLGLVLLIAVSSDAMPYALQQPQECCFDFATFKIPNNAIQKVIKTSDHCPNAGYIYTTPKGRICKKNLDIGE